MLASQDGLPEHFTLCSGSSHSISVSQAARALDLSECNRLVSTVNVKTVLASRHDEDNSCLCWLPIALRVSGNVVRQELAALLSPDGSSVPSEALKVR
jgi:hypothetical protein